MKVYGFPGQGSQAKGMGAGLFDGHPALVAAADGVLGYSIRDLCLNNPEGKLARTEYTQPALFVVNALEFLEASRKDPRPCDFLMGHSLGEYSALFAAGCFDFETGLRLVVERGKLMGQVRNGGMAAVLDCPLEEVRRILSQRLQGRLEIANINSPTQVVVSGDKDAIAEAQAHFSESKARYIPLNVSGAFHSRLMEGPAAEFRRYLKAQKFLAPRIPVIANFTAQPYSHHDMATTLADQMSGTVRWLQSVEYVLGRGEIDFRELGPGNVLTKLVGQIAAAFLPPAVATPAVPVASPDVAAPRSFAPRVVAESLGSAEFRRAHKVRYAYVAGAMVKGIASRTLVERMAKSGLLAFFGTGGVRFREVEESIRYLKSVLPNGESFGMNLLCNLDIPAEEMAMVDLFLAQGICRVEASGFTRITPALLRYRFKGLRREAGKVVAGNMVLAKLSRPEVAEAFLRPAPQVLVDKAIQAGWISAAEAEMGRDVAMADDICVEADSGGHTDRGALSTLLPTIRRLAVEVSRSRGSDAVARVGAAGGLGTPDAIVAAFMLGAEFVMTGSVNQCTVEAGTSDVVKSMLQELDVQNTDYAPAGDMFEIGAKIQVMKKGVFFPMRASKLYDLWRGNESWDVLDARVKSDIEGNYFQSSFENVCAQCYDHYRQRMPSEIERAERNPKQRMAMAFKWYFVHSMRMALRGERDQVLNFQVHCGSSMGAANRWLKRTDLESWRSRHADVLADRLMGEASALLTRKMSFYA